MRRLVTFTGTSVVSALLLGLLVGFVIGSATTRHLSPWAPISCVLRAEPMGDLRPAAYEALRGVCLAGGRL